MVGKIGAAARVSLGGGDRADGESGAGEHDVPQQCGRCAPGVTVPAHAQAWLAVAAATAIGSTAAVTFVGAGILGPGGQPMGEAEVAAELATAQTSPSPPPTSVATAPSVSPATTTTTSTPSTSSAPARSLATAGGSIVAQCHVSWSPALGYGAYNVQRGLAPTASVTFSSGAYQTIATVSCQAGQPRVALTQSGESHGGGTGGGGKGKH